MKEDTGWLLNHSAGRFPGQGPALAAALAEVAATWCEVQDQRWDVLLQRRGRFATAIATVMGVEPSSLFPAENVTQAFQAFLEAIGQGLRGRRVLIAADCFPSLYWLLEGLAPHLGFELSLIPYRPGRLIVGEDDFLSAWDERVALAVVTWVTSTASSRTDLKRATARGRAMGGSLVAVDVTQGLGIVPLDLTGIGVDFAAGSSLKWLCGLPGAAFGYVRPGLLETLAPRGRGWFGKPDPFDWTLDSFSYADDARRFETGTPSPVACLGSLPGLEWLLRIGVGALRARNLEIGDALMEVADAQGLTVVTPREHEARGGSVVLELPARMPAADFVVTLARNGILADARGQRLRLSPGGCTAIEVAQELDRLLGIGLR